MIMLMLCKSSYARLTPRVLHSGATPVGCAHAHPLASQITPRVILFESPEGSGATVGDQILGYPKRWS